MILVTGAAGLIGSAVARLLNRRGHKDLLLVDHLGQSEKWKNLRSLEFRHYMEKGEFLDRVESALQHGQAKELEDISAIAHLGAQSSTNERNASYLIENNYRYSIRLARFAQAKNIRMVYASSAASYGAGESGFIDDLEGLEKLRPLNAYGYSKHLFDLWLKRNNATKLFAGIKYFNVFGPNEYHKGDMRSLVYQAFGQIKESGSLRLYKSYHPDYEDGKQMRDFLYVEDAARMTVHLLLDRTEAYGIFNAGSGTPHSWLDLAETVFKAMGKKMRIEFIAMPPAMRKTYQYYTCASMEGLRSHAYQEKITSLADAVEDYIRHYLLREEPYA